MSKPFMLFSSKSLIFCLISLSILFVTAASTTAATSECSNSLTESVCTAQSGCGWVETNVTTCQQQVDCPNQTQVACSNAQLSQYCTWNAATEATCTVQPSACKLIDPVKEICSNEKSCQVLTQNIQSCDAIPKNFSCLGISNEPNCSGLAQCKWSSSSCISNKTCENYDINKCITADSACSATVTLCVLSIQAKKTCDGYTTSQECTQGGCAYDSQANTCNPPETCEVENNACTSAVCVAGQGTCTTKSTTCPTSNQDTCDQSYCAWSTVTPGCVNNYEYCTNCVGQGPYCELVVHTTTSCIPDKTNECSSLSQTDCNADNVKNLCTYTAGKEAYCSNPYQNCSALQPNQCASQVSCKQNSSQKSVCTSVVTPGTSFSVVQIAISLFYFVVAVCML